MFFDLFQFQIVAKLRNDTLINSFGNSIVGVAAVIVINIIIVVVVVVVDDDVVAAAATAAVHAIGVVHN